MAIFHLADEFNSWNGICRAQLLVSSTATSFMVTDFRQFNYFQMKDIRLASKRRLQKRYIAQEPVLTFYLKKVRLYRKCTCFHLLLCRWEGQGLITVSTLQLRWDVWCNKPWLGPKNVALLSDYTSTSRVKECSCNLTLCSHFMNYFVTEHWYYYIFGKYIIFVLYCISLFFILS